MQFSQGEELESFFLYSRVTAIEAVAAPLQRLLDYRGVLHEAEHHAVQLDGPHGVHVLVGVRRSTRRCGQNGTGRNGAVCGYGRGGYRRAGEKNTYF